MNPLKIYLSGIILFLFASGPIWAQNGPHYIILNGEKAVANITIVEVNNQVVRVVMKDGTTKITEYPRADVTDFGTMDYIYFKEKCNRFTKDQKSAGTFLRSSATKQGIAFMLPFAGAAVYLLAIPLAITVSTAGIIAGALGLTGFILTIASMVDLYRSGVMLEGLDQVKTRGIYIKK